MKQPKMFKQIDKVWLHMQFGKVMWITVFWIIISIMLALFETSTLSANGCMPAELFSTKWIIVSTLIALCAGVIGGSAIVFLFEKWIRRHAYWQAFLMMLVVFSIIFFMVAMLGYLSLAASPSGKIVQEQQGVDSLGQWIISTTFLRNYIIWLLVTLATTAGLLVNDKYGPGVLRKLLLGQYFRPRREERIFMFLDLRGSTSIAEELSPERYFALLRETLQVITRPILNSRGEIYQYVGDEVVISWTMRHGVNRANCIKCFHEIKEALSRHAQAFKTTYGIIPEYKAGLHTGHVVAGEIGVVKRDVTYTGDVLNTASRIQGMCNSLGVDILLSKNLLDQLALAPDQYLPKRLGEIPLRGKKQDLMLYTL